MFIFPRRRQNANNKENIFFIIEARQGLTLVLRISIENEKSGLHSSLAPKLFG